MLALTLAAQNVPAQTISVGTLTEARAKVRAFIGEGSIAAHEYGDACGRIERDGTPYARVSFHGRLWALDEAGRETYRAMDDSGRVSP